MRRRERRPVGISLPETLANGPGLEEASDDRRKDVDTQEDACSL